MSRIRAWMTGFLRQPFWRKVMTLASGTLLAQAIGILSVLLLPRIYTDVTLGVFAFFAACIAVMGVVINAGYDVAIMLPEEDAGAIRLTNFSMCFSLGFSSLLFLLLVLIGNPLLIWAEVPSLQGWHLLIPCSLLLEGLAQPLQMYHNRQQAYKILSRSRAARAIYWVGLSLVGGLYWPVVPTLIIAWIAGQMARVLVLALPYAGWQSHNFQLKRLRVEARQYRDFPRYSILSGWFNTAAKQLPFYVLIPWFGEAMAGQFSQSDRILNLPISLIALTVGNVYYQEAQAVDSGKALWKLTRRTLGQLAFIGLPFLTVIMIWGPDLFAWVLGEEWRESGVYARWLMPWAYMVFLAAPLSFIIDIRRKLRAFMYYNLALFVVRAIVLYLGWQYLSPLETVMAFGISGAGMVAAQLAYQLWLAYPQESLVSDV